MMGGGFGGCTINIIRKDMADRFILHLTKAYRETFSIDMRAYKVSIRDGTSVLSKSTATII
jgi:galactokinase